MSHRSQVDQLRSILDWMSTNTAFKGTNSVHSVPPLLQNFSLSQWTDLINCLAQGKPPKLDPIKTRIVAQLLAAFARNRMRAADLGSTDPLFPLESLDAFYHLALTVDNLAAGHCLQVLALQADEESIRDLADVLSSNPPEDWRSVAVAMSPLWHANRDLVEFFFDQLEDGLFQPSSMAVLLDLANYATRNHTLAEHPWMERSSDLARLLQTLHIQLEKLQDNPAKFGNDVDTIQRTLNDAIALTVSLCDALGLIGSKDAIPVLREVLELSHRRIQTEAAGALARLGDDVGAESLIRLASDRVARARAVAYAEELEIAERISENLRVPAALAESELAVWLASGDQFGFPPTSMELLDSRTLYWPSFEDPQNCFLFNYVYEIPGQSITNVGLAGPVTHAFQANIGKLPLDDIYAAFAGWHAEHDEIYEIPADQLNTSQLREADLLAKEFERHGIQVKRKLALTFLLGELALLAEVEQAGRHFVGISDGEETFCLPRTTDELGMGDSVGIGPDIVLHIFRGRKLLRSFNP
ncbi:MAG: HEAT repeat domain-containing protein [Planctomycetales bacterium]|nr:HEAT repeat domain-containing protein [Planctomycetales bacterium]